MVTPYGRDSVEIIRCWKIEIIRAEDGIPINKRTAVRGRENISYDNVYVTPCKKGTAG